MIQTDKRPKVQNKTTHVNIIIKIIVSQTGIRSNKI